MSKKQGRTARHRRVARELVALRQEAGFNQAQAAQALGWDRTTLVRVESTETTPTLPQVSQILGTYGGDDQGRRLAILELFKHIRERGWWVSFSDILDGSYVDLENDADRILIFQAQIFPGLLQESGYASGLIRSFTKNPQEHARRLDARMMRRAILEREKPPFLDVVVTEDVLDCPIGGPDVMRAQLTGLLALIDSNLTVSVRVIPRDAGAYPTIGLGSIVIFEFDSPIDLNTAHVETFAGGYYVEETSEVRSCTDKFHQIVSAALTREESRALIATKI
jgi:DNA-binding XRE family transcriptional regulator